MMIHYSVQFIAVVALTTGAASAQIQRITPHPNLPCPQFLFAQPRPGKKIQPIPRMLKSAITLAQ